MPRWTPEARKQHSELMKAKIRLWEPWLQSTGAKTIEGKLRSSRNAYKHGCRSKESIQMMKAIREDIHQSRQVLYDVRHSAFW